MNRDKREPAVPSCTAADCHQWSCNKCTFINVEADFHCRQCGNRSWSDNTVDESGVLNSAADKATDATAELWVCRGSTFADRSNHGSNCVFAACSQPSLSSQACQGTGVPGQQRDRFGIGRLRVPRRRYPRDGTAKEQWSPEDCDMPTWQCDWCTAYNYAWDPACTTCHSNVFDGWDDLNSPQW